MKFGDDTQEISDFWREYYRELGLPVPLNQPGTNPSQLAVSPLLVVKKGIFMIQIFNPSRLTRQPFFKDLIDFLDQHAM